MYTYTPSLLEWHLHLYIFSQSNELSYGFYILSVFSCHVATKQQDSFFSHKHTLDNISKRVLSPLKKQKIFSWRNIHLSH